MDDGTIVVTRPGGALLLRAAPRRVTFEFSDGPTGSTTFPKHDRWTAPRWTRGTEYASMVATGGGSIGIQGGGTVSPWLGANVSVEQIKSFDISRSGNRVLVETVPAGSSNGPSRLVLWQNDGVSKSIDNTGHVVCQAESIDLLLHLTAWRTKG